MMFDAGHFEGSECVNQSNSDEDKSVRRQYTLKGVAAETIDLMREAADHEGMKIGSWVSVRMREAAERALGRLDNETPSRESKSILESYQEFQSLISLQQNQHEDRFLRIEREMHELVSGQRTILSTLLAMRQ